MTKIKRLVAVALAVLMILSSLSMVASAWDATKDDGFNLNITTKIFRQVNGVWTETEKVKQGEEVRARVYLDTDYYTNSGSLLFFYNSDFFTDSFGTGYQTLTVNPYYAELPYGITGRFLGSESSSQEQIMVSAGKITSDFAAKHDFIDVSYSFYGESYNQMLSDDQWLFEVALTVKSDATGTGDFFAVEETTRSSSFQRGRINVPKGPYNGYNEDAKGMHLWDANLTYTSHPVSLYTNFVTASFDAEPGKFASGTTKSLEGDAGDPLTVEVPTRANFEFAGWAVKGGDGTAQTVTVFPDADTEYEAVWKSTTGSDETLAFKTEIYRQDPETGEWIFTEKVKPGEIVKARLFVDTSYFTNAGDILLFYDSEFFTDSYTVNANTTLDVNDDPASSAAINGTSGYFAKILPSNMIITDLVDNGYITDDFAKNHQAFAVRYQFNPTDNKIISGETWFAEFDLQVRSTARGEGDFFIVEETIMNSAEGVNAYINLPLGEEGKNQNSTLAMCLWDANVTVESYPVTTYSSITLQANGGEFDADDKNTFVLEGDVDAVTEISTIPELTKAGYTFKGWVDAAIENPTEADVVELPATMPYDDLTFKALWVNDVEITYVFNNGDANIVETVTAGDDFVAPADPVYDGYIFIGWTSDDTYKTITGLPEKYPTEDETYYAVFESGSFKVNYFVFNNETLKFDLVREGSTAYGDVIPAVPAMYKAPAGYALSAAYTDINLTTPLAAGTTMPAEVVNLYYKLSANTYEAVFYVDGEVYDTVTAVYDEPIVAPADPEKEGYVFDGWDPYVGNMDEEGKIFNATWAPAVYTATYNVDGAEYEAYDIAYGEELDVPADPYKEGYDFLGWTDTEGSTTVVTLPATMPAEDVTYYAVFEINEYTLTFTETGDSVIDPITQDYGTEITAPADPEKKGWTFTGWVDADGNKVEIPATMPAEDMTLKATWEINSYTVTWVDGVDSTEDAVDTYEYGATIVLPENPTKTGYTFEKWSPDVEATMPDYDLTYVAVWTVNEYDAVFDANNGYFVNEADAEDKSITSKTVKTAYEAEIVAPADPVRAGYVFAGWDPAVGTMDSVDGKTFTAKWDAAKDTPYTVEYYTMNTTGDYGDPVVENRTGETLTTATVTASATDGFYIAPESVLSAEIAADGSTVLKVYYARNLYTIVFDGNDGLIDGAEETSGEYYHGAAVVAPAEALVVREGYTFDGWNPGVSSVAVANATYYAQWDANEYTIVFDTDGGTAVDSVTADYGSSVNAPVATTTKEGYTFNGWAETQGETEAAKAVTFPVTMPIDGDTYYAIWTPNEYTITFADTGDSVIDPITQDFGTDVTAPADPVKEGYTFDGWDKEVPKTMPAGDMTITAQWKVNSYDITWDVDGTDTTENVEFGSEIVAPEDPVKDGYTFTGWKDADGKTPDDYVTVPSKDVEFTAQWTANDYTITFETNGGSEIAAITQPCDSAVTAPANPIKEGYTFDKWVDEKGAETTVPATMPAGDTTLYATWIANSDTEYKVVVNYTDFNTGAAEAVEHPYTGTTDNAILIVEAKPDPATANTEYVLMSDLAVEYYELDTTAENDLTGTVAADGSTVLNIYLVPVKHTATFNTGDGAFADGSTKATAEISHGSLVKPNVPAEEPTREGYTFDGWQGVNDTTKLTGDRTFNAAWKANTYNLTWVVDDNETPETYEYNALINKQVDPTKEGYTFAGWEWTKKDADGNDEVISAVDNMPAYDVIVTATWTVNSYDLTWKVDDVETTESVEYGSAITAPADPEKEGYTFAGWSPEVDTTMPAGDVTYTAQWTVNEYTVSYYVYEPATGKFASAGTANVAYGTEIPTAVPADYTVPTGYSVVTVAYTDVGLTTPLAAGTTMPAADVALYYELDANTYEALFKANGGKFADDSTEKTVEADYNAQIVAPADPTRDGYTFNGWTPAVGTMNDVNGKTYEAVWVANTYNAIFKANGGAFADGETTTTVPTEFGAEIIAPAAPTRTGYTFNGWNPTVPDAMPSNDVTFTAQWTIKQATITFDTDGGSTVAPITQDYGTAITAPAAPTKDGYSFAGWDALPTTMPAENTTVKALWTKNSYTVTWNVDGVKNVEIYEFGATIKQPENPAKEGHTFNKWTPDVAATMPAYNVEYTATWNVVSYVATFDANDGKYSDGTTSKDVTVAYGDPVVAPAVPTRDGYTFAGWEPVPSTMPAADTTYKAVWASGTGTTYTVEIYEMDTTGNYGTPKTEGKTATTGEMVKLTATPVDGFYLDETKDNVLESKVAADGSTVLKVYYARNQYTITFNGNEGTIEDQASKTGTYYHGAAVVAPTAEREGYTFTGWDKTVDTVAVANATYDAQWAVNQYTITFDTDGGTEIAPITQDFGSAVTAPENPTKEGYTFDKWVDEKGQETSVPATMPSSDSTIKATWTVNQYQVTFYEDDTKATVLQQTNNNYGVAINAPVATKEGHTFVAWVDAATGEEVDFSATVTTPATDVEYYATWDVNEYKLIYRTYNGVYEEFTVDYGTEKADMPAPAEDPTQTGYEFAGWTDLPATMPARPVTINAKWNIKSYDAKFFAEKDDTDAFDIISVVYNDPITAPADEPGKDGYTFKGWSLDGENVIDDYGTMGAEDKAFYAVWAANTDTVYNVEHYYMGVDKAYPDTATRTDELKGTTDTEATATPDTAENFTVDTAKSVLTGTIAGDGSLVLKVYYEREINTLKIDVDGVVTEKEYPFEAPVDTVTEPTKEGYTFDKWVDENGDEVSVPTTMPGDDVTIKATWTVNNYNVTYKVDGTVYDGPNSTAYGSTIAVPTAPTKAGYTFSKWVDADGKQPGDYGTMPAKDLEFTAEWTANANVGYVLEIYEMDTEGNYPTDATSVINFKDGVVGDERTAEYTVPAGFTLNETDSVMTGTIPATGTLVLKAYLERNSYKLNVVVDGTTTTFEYYYNETVDAVADPAKEGYVFAGWENAEGTSVSIPTVMPNNDVTVYATWDVDNFAAKFDAGEGVFESTGKPEAEVNVDFGEDITAPAEEPKRDGYTFEGWASADDPDTVITDFGKMDADGAEFVAVWSKTDFTVTFYNYKAPAGGPNAPTEKYILATGTYQAGDKVVLPTDPSFNYYKFLGWTEDPADKDNIIASDAVVTMPAEDYALYAVYEKIPVMLIPKNDTCTTVIDRAGGTVDDYTADSQWYVYGLKDRLNETTLLGEYIDVQGDGRIEIVYREYEDGKTYYPFTGTGTVINVYDRNGTDETSDDMLVESFHIIIFGDLNGDSYIKSIDASWVYDEAAGVTSWSYKLVPEEYVHYLVKAADINGDGRITSSDGAIIGDRAIGIVGIDQTTGRVED